ncbi:MAG: sulfotransferase [Myxococcota bacterium]
MSATPPDPDRSPIFVVGASRSGTTLLRMMLSAHPRIHLTMEASFYIWGALYTRFRDPDRFPPYYVRTFSYRWQRVDPARVLPGLPRPFRFADRKLLYAAVMREQAAQHGKPRYGDKTPGHTAQLARIFADWPDARVIRTVRDPREVIGSLVRMPWASPSRILAAAMTDAERRQGARFRDRILEVRLDELLKAPRETMQRVLDHVGEPWSDQVLEHAQHAPQDLPPMPWFAAAQGERTASGPRRTRDPVDVRLVEWLNGRGLRAQGLSPLPLDEEPGRLAVARRYLADVPLAVRGAWTVMRMARAGTDHARTAALLHQLNPAAWAAAGDFAMPEPPPLPEGWEAAWPSR